jgi:iron(III) transport system permease protein
VTASVQAAGLPRATIAWVALGWLGYAILPWYGLDGASLDLLTGLFGQPASPAASGLVAGLKGAWWLLPIVLPLLLALWPAYDRASRSAWAAGPRTA